jgi:hypothetical protein
MKTALVCAAIILMAAMPAVTAAEEFIVGEFQGVHADLTALKEGAAHPGVMRPDAETRRLWQEMSLQGPRAYIDPGIRDKRGATSLLSHLNYTPSTRNQGACGNCWEWAGTACFAIDLHVQEGIYDSLSVQHMNSCYGTVCCGGWAEYVSNFFTSKGYCIPWSNTNASWLDGGKSCGGVPSVSCGSISVTPNYDINSCSATYITTYGVTQATAIANIKNVLNQNKPVWFAFYAPTSAADTAFMNSWNNQSENIYLINFLDSSACGATYTSDGWGHAVLCYGYNDNDPNHSVWYMLNSWGTTAKRPRGTFYVDMDINYSCQYYDTAWRDNYSWASYDIDWNVTPATSTYRVLAKGDYNGDNYSDIAIFRPSTGMWAIRNLSTVYYGSSDDIPVPGDYNGDGRAEIAVYQPSNGKWAIRGLSTVYYGSSTDTPVPGDYNGDGRTDIAVFRPSNGKWAIRNLSTVYLGSSADLPVPGAYVNGTRSEIAIFRPSNGLWSIKGQTRFYLGASGDIPVPGNYTATQNGPWKAAIFRPSNGLWSVRGGIRCNFGASGDQPVPADFNEYYGDEIAIFRANSGYWSIRDYGSAYYGAAGDVGVTR